MERLSNIKKQEKLAKVFKAVISAGIVAPVFVSVSACEKAEPVVEESESIQLQETTSPTTTETVVSEEQSPPEDLSAEKEQKEVITEMEESQAEFNESMIKNRLIVAKGTLPEYPWSIEGEAVPLWYLQEWGECQFVASGVVAGPLRRDIGATGEEELLLPVAFQNPVTKKFYIRDISYGNDDFFSQLDSAYAFIRIPLEDYSFTLVIGSGGYLESGGNFEKIKPNLIVGDQVAFIFRTTLHPGAEKSPYPEAYKIYKDFMDVYNLNNISVLQAMKSNKDLPEVKLFAWVTVFNEVKDNN